MTRKLSTKELLDIHTQSEAPELLAGSRIWLHNVRSLHNVGSVFRSADAFGIKEILLSGYTPIPPRPEITKTAIGAEEFVDWKYFEDADDVFKYLQRYGAAVYGLEQTTDSIPLPSFNPPTNNPLCLLMGNEVTGIEDELLARLDGFLSIPQFGQKHSLNVSVATGVVLYALLHIGVEK